MTTLSKFLRKLRVDHGEVMYDMAKKLHVSSAFLSAVETGKRAAPSQWVEEIASLYNLCDADKSELRKLICDSIHQVRIDITKKRNVQKECAIAFARSFDDFSDIEIAELMAIIERRRSN